MKVATRIFALAAALALFASAQAAVEPISGGAGGYCVITRDGSGDVYQPADYLFNGCNGTFSLDAFDIDPFVMMLTGYGEGSD